jgi:hypothetical protein
MLSRSLGGSDFREHERYRYHDLFAFYISWLKQQDAWKAFQHLSPLFAGLSPWNRVFVRHEPRAVSVL